MKKSICALFSAIMIICTNICITANATVIGGECGANASWYLDNNILTISGTGSVDDGDGWIDYCESVTKIIVSEGITDIASYVFADCSVATDISLPTTLESIGSRAFNNCVSLRKLTIPDSVESINRTAFNNCDGLVLYCSADSYAETYAIQYSIAYQIIGNVTITFDANNGSGAPKPLSGKLTDSFAIPIIRPQRTGYIFVGWAKSANATEALYFIGNNIAVDADTTLYAVWLKCDITSASTENTIYINATAASPKLKLWQAAYLNKKMVAIESTEVELIAGLNTIPTKGSLSNIEKDEIKIFLWGNNLQPFAAANIENRAEYNVTFVDWDGGVLSSQTVSEGDSASLPTNPSRTGYDFCGWSGNYTDISADTTIMAQYVDTTQKNVVKVFSVTGRKGQNVKMMVYLGGNVELCGFDMRMNYDSSILELVNIDTDWNLDVIANSVPEDSLIKFNYGSSKNRTKSAKILEVEFKIKDTSSTSTDVTLTPVEIIRADSLQNNVPVSAEYNLVDGTVFIK